LLKFQTYHTVLAVKDERAGRARRGGDVRSLTAARRDGSGSGNPAQDHLGVSIMNANVNLSFSSHASAFDRGLSLEAIRERAPAVFAPSAHERMSLKYTFIPTERILTRLMSAEFVPVEARQTQARSASPLHARHIVRLRRRFETVQLMGSAPEVVFLNSHDGSSAYLRLKSIRHLRLNWPAI
jgi:Domain of unknown function (DUF932)